MAELLVGCLVGFAIVLVHWTWAQSRLRWMARHPAPTFLFADLVGYTALTERCGDEAGARVAREFRRAIAALSREHGARQVKSMGDGAMIWAPDPAGAVALAARTVLEIGTRPDLLPVRGGGPHGARAHARRRLVWQLGQSGRAVGSRGGPQRGPDQHGDAIGGSSARVSAQQPL